MGDRSAIQWTDATWNPIRGCSRVSEGCRNCYAERQAARQAGQGGAYEGLIRLGTQRASRESAQRRPYRRATWTGEVRFIPEVLELPFRWKRPRRIFVNSMSDAFHERVEHAWLVAFFGVMMCTRRHTFQVLTKRPERMAEWVSSWGEGEAAYMALVQQFGNSPIRHQMRQPGNLAACLLPDRIAWPLPNVWLGVSVEDRKNLDRLDVLRATPAAVRFVSFEPLLEDLGTVNLAGIHWVIVGGESGPGHRPMEIAWIESAVEQCRAAGVPIFVKQDSAPRPGQQGRIPDRLWLKEFPLGRPGGGA